ncbi:L,D-transpeptidase family protein [soil metagenome]
MIFTVTSDGRFEMGGQTVSCALGRSGVIVAADKREGDGATPLGVWPIRWLYYREDKGAEAETALPSSPIGKDDGWCDAPADDAYNRPVNLPYPASAERMWRDDDLYDRVIVLGHNDDPVVEGLGSAIFLHIARDGYAPTEGCVALSAADMDRFLEFVGPGDELEIKLA